MMSVASILVLSALTGSAALAAVTEQGAEGAELIGTQAPGRKGAAWRNTEPLRLEDLRGRVVLVRGFDQLSVQESRRSTVGTWTTLDEAGRTHFDSEQDR